MLFKYKINVMKESGEGTGYDAFPYAREVNE
jgi:hypothetical protein